MNGVKSQPCEPPANKPGQHVSGKLVIIGVLTIAITGAAVSWFFRYSATHRAAKFWGPEAATLIRDAPRVTLAEAPLASPRVVRDISSAPGITHLRNALLEDHNFAWGQSFAAAPKTFRWELTFSDPARGNKIVIHFTSDCGGAIFNDNISNHRTVSTQPIAKGLGEMFAEMRANQPAESSAPPK